VTRALITGITGQDGGYLAERLLAEGVEVHGMVHDGDQARGAFRERYPQVHLHEGDLADHPGLEALLAEVAPDEVYNLAGVTSVAFSWREPLLTAQLSGVAAAVIMQAALDLQERTGRRVAVLQTSSAEIFGQAQVVPQDESTPVAPVTPYGAAKAYAHHMARVLRGRGAHVATTILFNHESPRRPEGFVTRKITAGVARIAHDGGGTLTLGNLDSRRDWGWAPDYVDAMVRAVRHPVADDFVVATGQTHSVAEFVAAAFARVGIEDWERHVVVDPDLVRPVDAALQVGDAAKARRELGWEPTVAFDEIVGRMVDHDVALLGGASA
jgi:GDPmannose 4,6-dehydratase